MISYIDKTSPTHKDLVLYSLLCAFFCADTKKYKDVSQHESIKWPVILEIGYS